MNIANLLLVVVVFVSLTGEALGCGPDPCAPFYLNPQSSSAAVDYVASPKRPEENLRILLKAYFGEEFTKASAAAEGDDGGRSSADGFASFATKVDVLFRNAGLAPAAVKQSEHVGGYGSGVCKHNGYPAAERYLDALEGESQLKQHFALLVEIRNLIVGVCPGAQGADVVPIENALGKAGAIAAIAEHVAYLRGTYEFYSGRVDAGAASFERLAGAKNAWILDTAAYMAARAKLVSSQSQSGWDGWSKPTKIDDAKLDSAARAFAAYLRSHGKHGRYVSSARNIERRIAFLKNDQRTLNTMIRENFDRLLRAGDFAAITRGPISEVATYYDANQREAGEFPWQFPLIAAAKLLDGQNLELPGDALARLDGAKNAYEKYPGLFHLVWIDVALKSRGLDQLQDVQPNQGVPPAIRMSQMIALARAREFARDHVRALKLYRDAMNEGQTKSDPLIQFGIARNSLAADQLFDLARSGTPVTAAPIWEEILRHYVVEKDLVRLVNDAGADVMVRNLSRQVLLQSLLIHKRYPEFLQIFEKSERPAPFGEIETAAKTLIGHPSDPKALINAGYFLQMHSFGPWRWAMCCNCETLGTGLSRRDGELADNKGLQSPLAYYKAALGQFAKGTKDETEAKALNFAILCFKQGQAGADCLWGSDHDKVPESQRQAWFKTLKAKYPDSKWSKALKFYY